MRNKLCLAGVSALALLTSTPVLAQDLAPADEGEAIVVTGQRAQQERAIEIKRNAVGIMDVVAADEIGQHKAMPYEAIPEFVGTLSKRDAVAALALEFTILTAARTGEEIGRAHV